MAPLDWAGLAGLMGLVAGFNWWALRATRRDLKDVLDDFKAETRKRFEGLDVTILDFKVETRKRFGGLDAIILRLVGDVGELRGAMLGVGQRDRDKVGADD